MVVEHAESDIVHDAVEIVRHHKAAGDLDVRADDLQQRRRKDIIRVELARMCKNHLQEFSYLYLILNSVFEDSIAHFETQTSPGNDAVQAVSGAGLFIIYFFFRLSILVTALVVVFVTAVVGLTAGGRGWALG